MSKSKIDISKSVMSKIEKGQVTMKPRWVFVAGTFALVVGVFGIYLFSGFLVSLISFSLRTHGPMGIVRYQELLSSFPWWAIGLAVVGLTFGITLLKRFDFSYKNNFIYIIIGFVMAVIISGWLADYFGLDRVWSRQGQMKRLYQRYDGKRKVLPWRSDERFIPSYGVGQGKGRGYNGY